MTPGLPPLPPDTLAYAEVIEGHGLIASDPDDVHPRVLLQDRLGQGDEIVPNALGIAHD